ncbi:MAG TPA: aspartate racemase [Acholeplasmataceae bacterium]|nr:aspartate racemase [Acholeplasmataceae bacterium]
MCYHQSSTDGCFLLYNSVVEVNFMKTLAMLGGMSYESTTHYYQIINEEINKHLKGSHSAKILMYSFDYSELEKRLEKGQWDQIKERLIDEAKKLKSIGAEGFILCANTMHIVAHDVEKEVGIPLIHIAEETMKIIKEKNLKKVGLIGTSYTMKSHLYDDYANQFNIELVKPNDHDQDVIHRVIYNELIVGVMRDESRRKIVQIIDEMHVEGIILGCTELPFLIKKEDLKIERLDTLEIHAKQAALWMIGENL